ncbi:hypothetical protein [Fundidesulfovibrio agrisoli]|uniref:hypothetical protein n=1 Tax=Fundidesulfovibrio agrisoli TaxID=2922717 RepID=UPI001FADAF45|nr:hypothetical protein [Fundidesulfovibrio agrisoli]
MPELDALTTAIKARSLPDGGFALSGDTGFRVDATAWAVAALRTAEPGAPSLPPARARLASCQTAQGAVPFLPDTPDAIWPTPLAMFAWLGAPGFEGNLRSAQTYLLQTNGAHWPRKPDSPISHDPALRGWPWTLKTHSWIEPTALAILALAAAGSGGHPRVEEGRRMILDRQLPAGGWNYGNVMVYGQELLPNPECAGQALAALAGSCPPAEVSNSLDWLERQTPGLRTPFALSWAVLGLSAWGRRPDDASGLIARCLEMQEQLGPFETWHLALLLLAARAEGGLAKHLAAENPEVAHGAA